MPIDDLVAVDWALTVFITVAVIFVALQPEMFLPSYSRVFIAVVFGWYMAVYIDTAWIAPYIGDTGWTFVVSVICAVVVVLINWFVDLVPLLWISLGIMSTYGISAWYWDVAAFVIVGLVLGYLIYHYELEYLQQLMWDSLVIAICVAAGVTAMITNMAGVQTSPACTTGHVDMLLPFDKNCGSFWTNSAITLPAWGWALVAAAIAVLRFMGVYLVVVCGRSQAIKATYQQSHPPKKCCDGSCCGGGGADSSCCWCWVVCCGAKSNTNNKKFNALRSDDGELEMRDFSDEDDEGQDTEKGQQQQKKEKKKKKTRQTTRAAANSVSASATSTAVSSSPPPEIVPPPAAAAAVVVTAESKRVSE